MKKIYSGKSDIAGIGLFSKQELKKGEIAFIMKGEIIKINSSNRNKLLSDEMVMGIDKNTWIRPILPFIYINHSCNPNTGVKGKVTFIALRNVKRGEELTFDYSISEETKWSIRCSCKENNCRKIIRSIQYLPLESYKKYLPYVPTYFRQVYERHLKFKNQ